MLNFGNKEFRNLQEQVLENAKNIETLKGREDLQIVIVNELPAVGNPNYIYLVAKNNGESPDVYDEYIWLENEQRYEKIGGVSIDMTNYVTIDSEQTISGVKTFSSGIKTASVSSTETLGLNSESGIETKGNITPQETNTNDVGSSSKRYKDLYISGNIYHTSYYITWDNGFIFKNSTNETLFYVGNNGQPWIYGDLIPAGTSGKKDIGNSSHYFRDVHLTGSLKDGVNTVTVANISSKATSTFISGTFDSNGESTIDTEQAGTPEGLFIFTYGNCQCFLRLTATMVQNADTTPIRVACPMIYNSDTVNGWLNITKSGYILILKITDGTKHVDSGFAWTLTKTSLI